MKTIKIGKKEYVIVEKEKLDLLTFELGWRLGVVQHNAEVIEHLRDDDYKKYHFAAMKKRLSEAVHILDKYRESL